MPQSPIEPTQPHESWRPADALGAASGLLGLPRPKLGQRLDELGIGARHEARVFRGIQRNSLRLDGIDGLGPRHSATLTAVTPPLDVRVSVCHASPDGTQKLVFLLPDGAHVEGVLIPSQHGTTLCVSTQVGCAMGCAFCATARMGPGRNLTAGEIVSQVHLGRAWAQMRREGTAEIGNLVFMGMGEPLHNYDATRDAVAVLIDDLGLAFAPRRVTVSTVGLVAGIRKLGSDFGGRVQLALSLNAGSQATRLALMPMARRHDLAALKAACLDYPLPSARHVLIEYVLLAGVTDTQSELDGLIAWTRDLSCVVNLIPFNPFPGARFRAPPWETVDRAWQYVRDRDVAVTTRRPRGADAWAACGQLALMGSGDGDRPIGDEVG